VFDKRLKGLLRLAAEHAQRRIQAATQPCAGAQLFHLPGLHPAPASRGDGAEPEPAQLDAPR